MTIAVEILDDVSSKLDSIKFEIDRLRQELSRVDMSTSDILHFLEFETLSAAQGYKYARMLKNLRIERRHIKSELEELQTLYEKMSEFNIEKIRKKLVDLENRQLNRKYTPRIFTAENREIMSKII